MHNIHTNKYLENCIKENEKLLCKVLCKIQKAVENIYHNHVISLDVLPIK